MRKSDKKAIRQYRSSERFFRQDDQWFFQTREGARGPFKAREIAEQALDSFVDTMKFVEENEQHLPSDTDWNKVTIADANAPRDEIQRRK